MKTNPQGMADTVGWAKAGKAVPNTTRWGTCWARCALPNLRFFIVDLVYAMLDPKVRYS